MLDGKRIAVVVPAYDETSLLPQTLTGIPSFVDRVYVVDDASTDDTVERSRTARFVRKGQLPLSELLKSLVSGKAAGGRGSRSSRGGRTGIAQALELIAQVR